MLSNKVLLTVFSCVLLLAIFSASIASAEPVTEVYQFNDDNFYSYIKENPQKRIFMKFYAPWCGHCKRMADTYIEVAKDNTDEDIVYGEIDCTQSKVVCKELQVNGYPTLKVINNLKYAEHEGGRDAESIVESARTLVTTEAIKIIEPPAPPATDFVSVLFRHLAEIWNIRRNALTVLVIVGVALGYIVRGAPSKK